MKPIRLSRKFTTEGVDPFTQFTWVPRTATISEKFLAKELEFPDSWSQNSVNIVATKFLRVVELENGTLRQELSAKDMIERIASTLTKWGLEQAYFSEEGAAIFHDELVFILCDQRASFNSPVWFNVGTKRGRVREEQCSACFINGIEDTMESILDLGKIEGKLYKGGSGSGVNYSKLRSSREFLSGGGYASGPVPFIQKDDANAGAIKSGGTTRRAAKMVILNIDHGDIQEFIQCKARAEKMVQALIAAGFDSDFRARGGAYDSIPFQNGNNTVRVTREFMQAVRDGKPWNLLARDGKVLETVDARKLWTSIAEAAHACGCPGLHFDDEINKWHTTPKHGRINGSNPCCFTGDTLVLTTKGAIRFDDLFIRMQNIESDHSINKCLLHYPRVMSYKRELDAWAFRRVVKVWVAGTAKALLTVTTHKGLVLRCTPEHKFLMESNAYVEAQHLQAGDKLRGRLDDYVISVESNAANEPVYDMEVEDAHNFSVTSEGVTDHSVIVHNSEYMSHDDSACNLASLNICKCLHPDLSLDVDAFNHTVDIIFLGQDIVVDMAAYPTEKIQKNASDYRQIGLGYANLGAWFMQQGLPYDSDEARALAAQVTALLTGRAYFRSAEIAAWKGPFRMFHDNTESMMSVMRMHQHALADVDNKTNPIFQAAQENWRDVLSFGTMYGYRNSQATVIAPTGTIGFMMDCDTTGIEPEIALAKTKMLVGGGKMRIVNQCVPRALAQLHCYSQSEIDSITAYVLKNGSVVNSGVKPEHYAIFDGSFAESVGGRFLRPEAHILMLAAVQPFVSGSISKTVNVPGDATVADIEKLYMMAYEEDLKCVAIYRDGAKQTQPLKSVSVAGPPPAVRHKLPDTRQSVTHKFAVAGHEGYMHVGLYENGQPGELFIDMAKEGSTISGLMDSFATGISLALQHGTPLDVLIAKFTRTNFAPSGFTGNPDIPRATSLMDYIFTWLEKKFILVDVVPVKTFSGMMCPECGTELVQTGTCRTCPTCTWNGGCG